MSDRDDKKNWEATPGKKMSEKENREMVAVWAVRVWKVDKVPIFLNTSQSSLWNLFDMISGTGRAVLFFLDARRGNILFNLRLDKVTNSIPDEFNTGQWLNTIRNDSGWFTLEHGSLRKSACRAPGHGDKKCKSAVSWNQHQTLTDFLCFRIYCTHPGTPWNAISGSDLRFR